MINKKLLTALLFGVFLRATEGSLCAASHQPQCSPPCFIAQNSIETEEFQFLYLSLPANTPVTIQIAGTGNTDVDVYVDDAELNTFPSYYENQFSSEAEGSTETVDLVAEEDLCLAVAFYGWEGGSYSADIYLTSQPTSGTGTNLQARSFSCDSVEEPDNFRLGMSMVDEHVSTVCTVASFATLFLPAAGILNKGCENWDSIKGIADFLLGEPPAQSVAMVNCWTQKISSTNAMTPLQAFTHQATQEGIVLEPAQETANVGQDITRQRATSSKAQCSTSEWLVGIYKSDEVDDVQNAQTEYLINTMLLGKVDSTVFATFDPSEMPVESLSHYWRNKDGVIFMQNQDLAPTEDWTLRFCEVSVASVSGTASITLSSFVLAMMTVIVATIMN